jgi:hypothetical protein
MVLEVAVLHVAEVDLAVREVDLAVREAVLVVTEAVLVVTEVVVKEALVAEALRWGEVLVGVTACVLAPEPNQPHHADSRV